jgi:quinol monooxygenase YgiN
MTADPQIVELRQYTLRPEQREVLIELFEREFIETQEAAGITLIGLFRDLDDPDRFVWLRGFQDMDQRRDALTAFYGGPAWAAHREAANATMIDSDNVLLLRPGSNVRAEASGALIAITVQTLDAESEDRFERQTWPDLERAGAQVLAWWVTEPSANTFPRLPVREGEKVLVWMATYPDPTAHAACLAAVQAAGAKVLQRLRLEPTRRSAVR